jgi:hypothetical protein
MNTNDPFIQYILSSIQENKSQLAEKKNIIHDIQIAFEFHLINFTEYEALLVQLLSD